jgi:hypothetical protein
VLRGYDPDEVTSAITDLTSSLTVARRTAAERTMQLSRAQERTASLEAELREAVEKLASAQHASETGSAALVDVGTRLGAILRLAEEEAGRLRAEGQRFADDLRETAETEARRIREEAADAERAAARVTLEARREADRAGRRARNVTLKTERTRDEVVKDLHGVLGVLADIEGELADDEQARGGDQKQ